MNRHESYTIVTADDGERMETRRIMMGSDPVDYEWEIEIALAELAEEFSEEFITVKEVLM